MSKNNIKLLRQKAGLTQRELAAHIGTSTSAIAMYERGERFPNYEILERLADFFNVEIDFLLNRLSFFGDKTKIPVYGEIAAGYPMLEVQDIEDYEEISEEMARSGDYIALRIHGESMMPRICDGDVIIIRLQNNCDNGDICAVCVNGDTATCKKVKYTENGMMLLPLNPSFDPMFYTKEECENLPVRIIGKVVELRGKF